MSVSDDGYLDPISENSHISTDGSEEWMKFWTEIANIVSSDLLILNFICSISFARGVQNLVINSQKIIISIVHDSSFPRMVLIH
jgi:hypothetical protein